MRCLLFLVLVLVLHRFPTVQSGVSVVFSITFGSGKQLFPGLTVTGINSVRGAVARTSDLVNNYRQPGHIIHYSGLFGLWSVYFVVTLTSTGPIKLFR